MTRRIRGVPILAGLAVLGLTLASGRDVQAARVGLGGSITPLPGGSPFLYQFELTLTSGSIAPSAAGLPSQFTVDGLVGVSAAGFIPSPGSPPNPQSGTSQPPSNGSGVPGEVWIVPAGGIVTSSTGNPAPYHYASNITWNYFAGPTITWMGTDISLGVFTVQTIASFPDDAPPVIPGVTPIVWSYLINDPINGPSSGGGTITLRGGGAAVPEPASLGLLIAGGGLPLALGVRRRRARSRRAA